MAQINITSTPLPDVQWQGNLQDQLELFANHLEGEFTGGVLLGQVGGDAPTSDIGRWVSGNVDYVWNATEARYLPVPVTIGKLHTAGTLTFTTFQSTATADRTLYTPDKDGILATTADVLGGRGTNTVNAASPTIDWSTDAGHYYLTLTGNAVITHTNGEDGQERHLWIENPASASYTVTFTDVIWPGGTPPTQTVGAVNTRKIDHYRFWKIGDYVFGEAVQDYAISTLGGSGGDVTAPTVQDIQHNYLGNVHINMGELLQYAALTLSDFTVKKNGVTQALDSATANGYQVLINTSTTFTGSNTVTVQYTGTGIKDVAGNVTAPFGPSASTWTYIGGGPGGGQNEP